MFSHVSLVGILLAALSAMVIGMIWYSLPVFGKSWRKMLGVSDEDMKKKMGPAIAVLVVVSLVTAYVLAHFIVYTHGSESGGWIEAGVKTALWGWVGLAATAIVAHGVFDPRNKKVLYINAGNRLVTLVVMGLIIGAFAK